MTDYCSECGEKLASDEEFCSNCGTKKGYDNNVNHNEGNYNGGNTNSNTSIVLVDKKNPGLAAVLSFFVIGLGQIYNGELTKGLILLIVSYVCVALFILILPAVVTLVLWIYSIYDAYNTAKDMNEGMYI